MDLLRLLQAAELLRAMSEHVYCYQPMGNRIHVSGKQYCERDLVDDLKAEGLVDQVSPTRWKITFKGREAVANIVEPE